MTSDQPAFDEIHVVSDLHMGGKPGFQILRETGRLAGFVRRLAGLNPDRRLALVLNGDVFDTLAEDVDGYVALESARATVERIMDDAAFRPVWDALGQFVRQPGRTLVIVIGNHDIEIAFPPVQRLVVERLAEGDLAAQARIEFSTAGAGYACDVGGARVYCIHGNEVDAWNYNRYEDLAKVARRLNAGLSLSMDEWQPNAGTMMVKDVMNEIKRKRPWIDLLKPETSAAIGTLLVLDPAQLKKIHRLFGIVGERRRGTAQVDARLSAEGFVAPDLQAPAAPPPTLEQAVGPSLRQAIDGGGAESGGADDDADDMLRAAERNFARPRRPAMLPGDDGTLGLPQLIVDRLTGRLRGIRKPEALRRALCDWLRDDKTFDFGDRDDTFRQVSASVGPTVDFIVTGHTHLERAIDMGNGRCYFNAGTWIRLLRFTDAALKDEASFEPVFRVLEKGSMQALDDARFGGEPFVLDRTSVVTIRDDGGRVTGTLAHVLGDGSGEPEPVHAFTRP